MSTIPTVFPKLRGGEERLSRAQDNADSVLRPVAQALSQTPIMGAAPPAWILPDLTPDFANTAGLVGVMTGYHKDALGYVWVKIKVGTNGGKGAFSKIFSLPQGYRMLSPRSFVGVNTSTGVTNTFQVQVSGDVVTITAIGAAQSVEVYFAFLAEA